jgi:hypothetical protein
MLPPAGSGEPAARRGAGGQQGRKPRADVRRNRAALLEAARRRSEELVALQEEIARLGDADDALERWLRALGEYFSAFSGSPEPLMAAARAQDPGNPLTFPCGTVVTATEEYVQAAQRTGSVRESVKGHDLFPRGDLRRPAQGCRCRGGGVAGPRSRAHRRRLARTERRGVSPCRAITGASRDLWTPGGVPRPHSTVPQWSHRAALGAVRLPEGQIMKGRGPKTPPAHDEIPAHGQTRQ